MTNEDWKTLESGYGLYNPIRLICDGFKIKLEKQVHSSRDKLYNMIYVNGWMQGKWLFKEGQHAESKFMYEKKSIARTHSEAELRKMRRELGAKFAKMFEPKTFVCLQPWFPSFSAFKRQMIKNCTSIEIDKTNG